MDNNYFDFNTTKTEMQLFECFLLARIAEVKHNARDYLAILL
jgi:hypothetical protein